MFKMENLTIKTMKQGDMVGVKYKNILSMNL